ncbi:Hypothetical protein PACV_76 [Pacmanvirus A23]|uniref:Hypothetical protein n=1 Tax=Pacmanvirus A23 TaxID=1932881 RepID=UPI000A095521|nr:Hypothetical protein B9W72_gp076 [Pacmanvirus A23]SIP85793.1 Hypothetical protein PACV_76 [Pacmanvirus A23]
MTTNQELQFGTSTRARIYLKLFPDTVHAARIKKLLLAKDIVTDLITQQSDNEKQDALIELSNINRCEIAKVLKSSPEFNKVNEAYITMFSSVMATLKEISCKIVDVGPSNITVEYINQKHLFAINSHLYSNYGTLLVNKSWQ